MDPGLIVRQCRSRSKLSVRALAEAAGVAASTVHRIERGQMDPTVATLTRITEAAGCRLGVQSVLDGAVSLAGLAQCIAADLVASPEDQATPVSRAAELVERFERVDPAARRRMLAAKPVTTSSDRWDALLAALAEWLAVRAQIDPPAWAHDPDRYLDRSWWVTPSTSMQAWEYAGSPMAFKQHGVYLHRDSLVGA